MQTWNDVLEKAATFKKNKHYHIISRRILDSTYLHDFKIKTLFSKTKRSYTKVADYLHTLQRTLQVTY